MTAGQALTSRFALWRGGKSSFCNGFSHPGARTFVFDIERGARFCVPEESVNKAEIVEALQDRLGGRQNASDALDAVIDTITRAVVRGEKVTISGFGSFEKAVRNARTGRNPRTGEKVKIKKTSVPRFRAGTSFKNFVAEPRSLPKATAGARAATTRGAVAAAAATKATPAKKTATKSTAAKTTATKTTAARKTTATKATPAKTTATATKSAAAKTLASKATPARKTATKATPAKTTATATKTAAKKAPAKTAAKKTATKSTASRATATSTPSPTPARKVSARRTTRTTAS
jgi:DNA-binding protein HU-beta